MKRTRTLRAILAIIFVLGAAASDATLTVNVDFNITSGVAGTFSGTAVAPDTGTIWNGLPVGTQLSSVASYTSPVLTNSLGVATGIQVQLTNFRAYEGPAPATAPALLSDLAAGVVADTPSNPSPVGFTISGLAIGGRYDLYFYSENAGYNNAGTAFVLNSITNTVVNDGSSGLNLGKSYTVFYNVVATGGVISGLAETTIDGNAATLNGFQIQESIPEPSTVLLLVTGGALVLVRRRGGCPGAAAERCPPSGCC